ncbi:MAG: hypothetical protein Q4P24_06820 [Rhodobacterales bacterium]|nr:hypothetical protein [Rhodobacterales bacterium]
MAAEPISTRKTDKDGGLRGTPVRDWLFQYGPNLAVLPYLAGVGTFTTYVGEIATPWTIGYLILWLIFAPIIAWSGVVIMVSAFWFSTACLIGLVIAVPFWPDAIWMFVTLFAALMLGGTHYLWVPIASFVAIVAGIYIWYTGGLGL